MKYTLKYKSAHTSNSVCPGVMNEVGKIMTQKPRGGWQSKKRLKKIQKMLVVSIQMSVENITQVTWSINSQQLVFNINDKKANSYLCLHNEQSNPLWETKRVNIHFLAAANCFSNLEATKTDQILRFGGVSQYPSTHLLLFARGGKRLTCKLMGSKTNGYNWKQHCPNNGIDLQGEKNNAKCLLHMIFVVLEARQWHSNYGSHLTWNIRRWTALLRHSLTVTTY